MPASKRPRQKASHALNAGSAARRVRDCHDALRPIFDTAALGGDLAVGARLLRVSKVTSLWMWTVVYTVIKRMSDPNHHVDGAAPPKTPQKRLQRPYSTLTPTKPTTRVPYALDFDDTPEPATPASERAAKKARRAALSEVTRTPGSHRRVEAAMAAFDRGDSPEQIRACANDADAPPPHPTPAVVDHDDVFQATMPASGDPERADHYERLVSQLESALATVAMLEARPGPPAYSDHVRELIQTLASCTSTVAPAATRLQPTKTTTFAQAAGRAAGNRRLLSDRAYLTQRPPGRSSSVHQPPVEPRERSTQPFSPPPPPTSLSRLILRWAPGAGPRIRESPPDITASLNAAFTTAGSPWIQGVNWSRAGNLVVHMRHPFTAAQLITHPTFLAEISKAVKHETSPLIDEAIPWQDIVINGIPGASYRAAYASQGTTPCRGDSRRAGEVHPSAL